MLGKPVRERSGQMRRPFISNGRHLAKSIRMLDGKVSQQSAFVSAEFEVGLLDEVVDNLLWDAAP